VSRPGALSALVAVVVLLTVELLRAHPAIVAWQLGGWGRPSDLPMVAAVVGPFLGAGLALLAPARWRPTATLAVAGLALAAARVGVQLVHGDAAVVLAGLGLAAGLTAVGMLALLGLPVFGAGVVAGVVLDAGLRSVLGTRSLVWLDDGRAFVAVCVLAAWLIALTLDRVRRPVVLAARVPVSAVALVAVGPVLFAEAFVLADLGWIADAVGIGWTGAALVVGVGGAVGIAAAAATARHPARFAVLGPIGGLGLMALAGAGTRSGWPIVAALVATQAGVGSALTTVAARGAHRPADTAAPRIPMLPAATLAAGQLLLLAALTVSDGRGVLGVPVRPAGAIAVIGVLLAGLTLATLVVPPPPSHHIGRVQVPSIVGVFALPAAVLLAAVPVVPVAGPPADAVLRVVTYNVSLGFGADGRPNLEGVGAVLAAVRPDVVGLQEVPRGGPRSGGIDQLGWLQRTLGLPYVAFQPAAPGASHGNAVLSRYPIRSVEHHRFRQVGTALPRGALVVGLEVDGVAVTVISAHLPPGGTPDQRASRLATLLDAWAGRPHTIITADTNSQGGTLIMRGLADAGLRATTTGATYPADAPRATIDWVLTSPDLVVEEARVVETRASDHLPIVALVRPSGG